MPKLEIGCRVELTGKNVQGNVAFIGQTHFETGTWVGIILDEPKGKNNGVVKNRQGISKTYFEVMFHKSLILVYLSLIFHLFLFVIYQVNYILLVYYV